MFSGLHHRIQWGPEGGVPPKKGVLPPNAQDLGTFYVHKKTKKWLFDENLWFWSHINKLLNHKFSKIGQKSTILPPNFDFLALFSLFLQKVRKSGQKMTQKRSILSINFDKKVACGLGGRFYRKSRGILPSLFSALKWPFWGPPKMSLFGHFFRGGV